MSTAGRRVVVVGSGIAGLTAALHAREAGHRVTLVTKGALGGGCTPLAQGGVAGMYGPGDSAEQHAADTLAAGAGLSDPAAVDVLVREGPERIAELLARGVGFDRAADGGLLLGREAAHSHARIVHAGGDATGAAISLALIAAVRAAGVGAIEHAFLVDVLIDGEAAVGVRLLQGRVPIDVEADAVILATGGAGQLYAHTTNPVGATGDGIAAALRAGAAVQDLEFVQFHPTVLADAGDAFLISEAVRGEGATLIDDDDHRFVLDDHPDGELAPRDVVARSIARRAAQQGGPVRLDATMIPAATLARRFPTIDRVTRERGLDWAAEPIPVTPAAHYLMGGIVTDLDGRTSIAGLFAVGEVARTGVHGANRLASNSLLEAAVFAARAAAAVSVRRPGPEPLEGPGCFDTLSNRSVPEPGRFDSLRSLNDRSVPEPVEGSDPSQFSRTALQNLLWDSVGLLRTDEGLSGALATIRGWRARTPAPRSVADHEDANLLLLAEATASAALRRTESVGAHHRSPALIGV